MKTSNVMLLPTVIMKEIHIYCVKCKLEAHRSWPFEFEFDVRSKKNANLYELFSSVEHK